MNQEQETLATELRNCAAYVESGRDALEGAGRGRELARLARRAADVLSALLSRTEQAEARVKELEEEIERRAAQEEMDDALRDGCMDSLLAAESSLKERNEEVERLREALAAAEARTVAEMEYANASRNLAAKFFKALSEIGGMPHYIAPIKPEHASSLHKRYEHALALAEAAVHSGGRTS